MTPAPFRILTTADPLGGAWTFTLELAQTLQHHGATVAVATMGTRLSDAQRDAALSLPNVHLHESTYKLEWMEEPWEDVEAAGAWLLELEDEYAPDVIHLNGYVHGSLNWRAPVLVTGHSCKYSRHQWVKDEPPPLSWETYRRRVAKGLQAANVVTTPSAFMLSELRKNYGFAGTGHVVYNARTPQPPSTAPTEPFIISAGPLWDEARNMEVLDEAAAPLSWPVYAVGERTTPHAPHLTFRNMVTLGALSSLETRKWMKRASIFALPARYESFGYAPLDAALSGCALLLGDIPSLREIWGHNALYVPPDEPKLLQQALTRLINDVAVRQRMARRAYRRALRYLPSRMARQYKALYTSAIMRHSVENVAYHR